MIYLDQAATSYPKPPEVGKAMCLALQTAGNSGRGGHLLSLEASRLVFEVRWELARFFGAEDASCLAFTANATESLNLALLGVLRPGDHVITTELEHNSVLRPLYSLEKRGVEVTILKADRLGVVDFSNLGSHLRLNTRALVVNHASNVTGNVVDLGFVGEFCQDHDLILIVDAAQTAGWYPYDLQHSPIDILAFTGHKGLWGPQGVGGIYVKPDRVGVRPLKTGGSGVQTFSKTHPSEMPEALEAGTLNLPGIAGLGAGLRYIQNLGLSQIRKNEAELITYFYQGVRGIPGIEVYGDFSCLNRCPIVSLNIEDMDSSLVSRLLAEEYGIFTRSGGHCAPLMHAALGTKERGAVRFSLSHMNTKEELDVASQALAELAAGQGREYHG